MGAFLATAFAAIEHFNYNAWYGAASAKLIDTSIAEIEAGRTEQLLPALRELRSHFQPTYENRAHYDQLVEQFAAQIKSTHPEKLTE